MPVTIFSLFAFCSVLLNLLLASDQEIQSSQESEAIFNMPSNMLDQMENPLMDGIQSGLDYHFNYSDNYWEKDEKRSILRSKIDEIGNGTADTEILSMLEEAYDLEDLESFKVIFAVSSNDINCNSSVWKNLLNTMWLGDPNENDEYIENALTNNRCNQCHFITILSDLIRKNKNKVHLSIHRLAILRINCFVDLDAIQSLRKVVLENCLLSKAAAQYLSNWMALLKMQQPDWKWIDSERSVLKQFGIFRMATIGARVSYTGNVIVGQLPITQGPIYLPQLASSHYKAQEKMKSKSKGSAGDTERKGKGPFYLKDNLHLQTAEFPDPNISLQKTLNANFGKNILAASYSAAGILYRRNISDQSYSQIEAKDEIKTINNLLVGSAQLINQELKPSYELASYKIVHDGGKPRLRVSVAGLDIGVFAVVIKSNNGLNHLETLIDTIWNDYHVGMAVKPIYKSSLSEMEKVDLGSQNCKSKVNSESEVIQDSVSDKGNFNELVHDTVSLDSDTRKNSENDHPTLKLRRDKIVGTSHESNDKDELSMKSFDSRLSVQEENNSTHNLSNQEIEITENNEKLDQMEKNSADQQHKANDESIDQEMNDICSHVNENDVEQSDGGMETLSQAEFSDGIRTVHEELGKRQNCVFAQNSKDGQVDISKCEDLDRADQQTLQANLMSVHHKNLLNDHQIPSHEYSFELPEKGAGDVFILIGLKSQLSTKKQSNLKGLLQLGDISNFDETMRSWFHSFKPEIILNSKNPKKLARVYKNIQDKPLAMASMIFRH